MKIKIKNGQYIEIGVRKSSNGIYEYFIENKKIGVYDPKSMEDKILFIEHSIEDEMKGMIKDDLNSIGLERIDSEAREREEIDTYTRMLGERKLNKNDKINRIVVMELEEDKKEENEQRKTRLEGQSQKIVNKENQVNVKQEIKIDERANDMQTIRQWLGEKMPKDIIKVGVIESYQMGNLKDETGKSYKENSTRYDLITINKKGEVEPLSKYIPELKQRDASGTNPTEKKYQVGIDGKVEKDAILSEYEIGDKVVQLDSKEYGKVEMNLGKEEHGGNRTMGVQVRDENTINIPSNETRHVIGKYEEYGQYAVNKKMAEAERHSKGSETCGKLEVKDIDGDDNTHSHSILEENVPEDIVEKFLEHVGDTFNRKDVEDKIRTVASENRGKDDKEILDKALSDLEEQAQREHDVPDHKRH